MYQYGDIITVKAFPNKTLTRRVVTEIPGRTVFLCNEEEFQAAMAESREPTAIGFPFDDVIATQKCTEGE